MKINSDYCLNLMKSRDKMEFIYFRDYSCIENFLISILVFTAIQFSGNPTSAGKDLMSIMVFSAYLEREISWIVNFLFI